MSCVSNSGDLLFEQAQLEDPTPSTSILCAADYPAGEVEWLWPGRIPIGKVTLLVGDPGNGKSLVALDIAARVSKGAAWPDQSLHPQPLASSLQPLSPGSVLILSIEDDLRDTIRPRLDAAGADPKKIFVLPSINDLRHDLDKLRSALAAIPDCRLIVIDSINAYVGPGDSHFHTIVRRVFKPLADLAAEKQLAVVAVSHLRKTEGAAIQRAAGSMGYVAAARAVWTVCRDQTQPGRQLLLPLKNNFAAETAGLAYTIDCVEFAAPKITWQDEAITTSAAEALTPPERIRGPEASELNLARKWLRQELADGPVPAFLIYTAGTVEGGFNERTLRRALDMLGGETKKVRHISGWEWSLPNQQVTPPVDPNSQESSSQEPDSLACNDLEPDPPTNLSTSEKQVVFERVSGPICQTAVVRANAPPAVVIAPPRFPVPRDYCGPISYISLKAGPFAAVARQSQMPPFVMAQVARRFLRSSKRTIRRRLVIGCRDP